MLNCHYWNIFNILPYTPGYMVIAVVFPFFAGMRVDDFDWDSPIFIKQPLGLEGLVLQTFLYGVALIRV